MLREIGAAEPTSPGAPLGSADGGTIQPETSAPRLTGAHHLSICAASQALRLFSHRLGAFRSARGQAQETDDPSGSEYCQEAMCGPREREHWDGIQGAALVSRLPASSLGDAEGWPPLWGPQLHHL